MGDWQVDLGKNIWYNFCLSKKKKKKKGRENGIQRNGTNTIQ